MINDEHLLNTVSMQAKKSSRLRMNYNFHESLEDKCHRMLNAVEPGTQVPIHRHPTKDESFVVLRGKVRVTTYEDDGTGLRVWCSVRRKAAMVWTSRKGYGITLRVWRAGLRDLRVQRGPVRAA